MPTATKQNYVRGYRNRRTIAGNGRVIVEHYLVDSRDFDAVETATNLPQYADEHPTHQGTFVAEIDIEEIGSDRQALVRVTYRPPDGSGGVIGALNTWTETAVATEGQQVFLPVDDAGQPSSTTPVAGGRGMPRQASRLIWTVHRYFTGVVPIPTLLQSMNAITPPITNLDPLVFPRVGGPASQGTFFLAPGQALFLGGEPIDLGNNTQELRLRFHVAGDHDYRWSTFNADGIATGSSQQAQRYGRENMAGLLA